MTKFNEFLITGFFERIFLRFKILKVTKLHDVCLGIKTTDGWYRLKFSKSDNEVDYS